MVRRISLVFAFLFLVLSLLTFVSADVQANFTTLSPSNGLVQRGANNFFNFSIGAISENITKIVINISGGQVFDPNSFVISTNGSSASGFSFINTSYSAGPEPYNSHITTLIFTNLTNSGIIQNGSTKYFWFNITTKSQAASVLQFTIVATGISGAVNVSAPSFGFSFIFSGYIKNETGSFQNSTNVSIYQFVEGQNGPPTQTLVASTLTNTAGAFTLSGMNASGGLKYILSLIYYNESDRTQALKIGASLPAFPAEMYYPSSTPGEIRYEFMRPPSLNGTTFYLGPAATINVTATNGTDAQRFGYMIMEQGTGFPIVSNSMANVTNTKIVVPTGRTYTLMLIRANSQFRQSTVCNSGRFMNDTACPTPPKSNSTLAPTSSGQTVNVNMDLTVSRLNLTGCIGVEGNSTPITNITGIYPRMTPWTGFVPPIRPDVQDINLSSPINLDYGSAACPGKIAYYSILLLNNDYLVEFYGRNNTPGLGGEFVAAFQNVSLTGGSDVRLNVTLVPMAGSFRAASQSEVLTGTGTNTTKFVVRIQNSSGGAVTQDSPHVELTVRNSVFGKMTYIIEGLTNGTFYLALPLNSSAKAKVFSNNAPPKEKVVNLSSGELNITLTSMVSGDAGFKKINSSGRMESMNITDSAFGMGMNFFRAGGVCDVVSPGSECNLTSMGATSFNPFTAMVAGKVNMGMKLTSSNVGITFYNFDMFAAKQPPMESVMDNSALSGAASSSQVWQFGSFVPAEVYDYAVVSIPYSDSVIDDSASVRMAIPYLYDENWNVVFNATRGDTTRNLSADVDDYLGSTNNRSFNSTGYREFLNATGVLCDKTDANITGSSPTNTAYCYVNTTANIIYVRVPHFSGVAPSISGTAPSTVETPAATSSGGGGGGSTVSTVNTFVYDDKELSLKGEIAKTLGTSDRIRIKISNETHYVGVIAVSGASVTVNISSTPQQATLSVGETKKFDVNADSYYDINVNLKSIINSSKADLTISYLHEKYTPAVQTGGSTAGSGTGSGVASGSDGTTGAETGNAGGSRIWIYVVIIVVAVLVIALLSYYFLTKKKNKKLGY